MTNYHPPQTTNTYSIRMHVLASLSLMRSLKSIVRVTDLSSIHYIFQASLISRIYASHIQSLILSLPKVQVQAWIVSRAPMMIPTPRLSLQSLMYHLQTNVGLVLNLINFSVLVDGSRFVISIVRGTFQAGQF